MLLNISPRSSQTLQEQIISQIRARILSGELSADQPLTSIRSLSQSLRVGINTVQRSYEQLLREELIYARAGKGFFVSPLEQSDKTNFAKDRFKSSLKDLIDEAIREGLESKDLKKIFTELQSDSKNGKT